MQIRGDELVWSGETFSPGAFLSLLAHETSHYYWRNGPTWLAEGAAVFMDIAVAYRLDDSIEAVLDERFGLWKGSNHL